MNLVKDLKRDLIKIMQVGMEKGIEKGSALVVEELEITKTLGLYRECEVDVTDPDVVEVKLFNFEEKLYYKKSEGKVKTFRYEDLKLPNKEENELKS